VTESHNFQAMFDARAQKLKGRAGDDFCGKIRYRMLQLMFGMFVGLTELMVIPQNNSVLQSLSVMCIHRRGFRRPGYLLKMRVWMGSSGSSLILLSALGLFDYLSISLAPYIPLSSQ
jgi:hypothetical protein